MTAKKVNTVLGPVAPENLGVTDAQIKEILENNPRRFFAGE